MSNFEIPITLMTIFANGVMFFTFYIVWRTNETPSYASTLFFFFNFIGFIYLSIGFKDQIIPLVKCGSLLIFVSYVLVASFLVDNYLTKKRIEEEANEKDK
ncbi:hypothetical protein OAP04_01125 [Pelagibacteraceae bacterium]|nr:hypothetical protein [Pelagibacteraceae bacterium]